MDKRVGAGVGLFLALEAINTYQLVLPPLYGDQPFDSQDIRSATRFVAIYILLLAFLTGILTQSVWPIVLPGLAIAAIYLVYMIETGNRISRSATLDEEG